MLAALTSTISLHEVATAYLHERFKLSRKKAATVVTLVCMTLGVFCALSFGLLNGIRLGGMTIFDLFDFVTAKLMLPLGGMFISIFTGWYLDKACTVKWNPEEDVVTGSMTLYAGWKEK